jgi:molybdenum cofactor synthesis domain-containing protein
MRPFTSTISLDEARRRLDANLRPISRIERVGLADAAGRIAASDVASPLDVPPFARSAMDGYAVIASDTVSASRQTPVTLDLIDRIYTGHPSGITVTRGNCAEIATGAPLPNGADAVVMVEETARPAGNRIHIFAATAPGQNVGRRGADIRRGDGVVSAGDYLTPSRIGALAAVGCAEVDVFARPRVAVLSTGNEVVEPGRALAPGHIFDVNRFTLSAIVAAHGGIADPRPPVPDTVADLAAALDACASADVIVFSGGSSVGERDLIVDALAARSAEMIFHGIAVRPGKPTAFARLGSSLFFGMPGNPTSCLSNAYIMLVPFLRAMARLPPYTPRIVRVPLARRIVSAAGRHQFYTVRIRDGAAHPAFKGSGDITSLSRADGYIEIAADQDTVEEGSPVDVTLF